MARPLWHYAALFLLFLSSALAASPPSFCKCVCFSNYTIIPLSAPAQAPDTPSSDSPAPHARSCADCTKQFCLDYNLPICEKATEKDVFTTCFQRDSVKDEIVVVGFVGITVGLLVWAGMKPVWEKWREGGYRRV